MSIQDEIQKLELSNVIELFVIDAVNIGGAVFRFHSGTNALKSDVVWQANTYIRFPIEATGFSVTSQELPRPKLRCSNFMGAVSSLLLSLGDMLGAKFIRKRTLAKFLDAENFPHSVNPTADDTAEFPDDIYYIDRKTTENREVVEFEMVTSFDLAGIKLPRRQIVQNVCTWAYRGVECNYQGTKYFNFFDIPVTDPGQDVCGKRISSCKCRFGPTNQLPYGGFPAAGLVR